MNDLTEDERILGEPPEPPDHVWSAVLEHAFDPWTEPDSTLVPTNDGSSWADADGDHLAATGDLTGTDDPLDHTPYYDDTPGNHDDLGYGYQDQGPTDTDGYF